MGYKFIYFVVCVKLKCYLLKQIKEYFSPCASQLVAKEIWKIFENGHKRVALSQYISDFEVYTLFQLGTQICSLYLFEPPNLQDHTHHTVL